MSRAESNSRRIPDLEDLAAYLDGRLTATERQAVEERLAEDSGYYETMLETVRFREEMEAEGSLDLRPPLASPRRPAPLWQGLAAAAVLLLVAGVWYLKRPTAADRFYASVDASAVLAVEGWNHYSWSKVRSSGLPQSLSAPELAFRLGAHLVASRSALKASHREAAYMSTAQGREALDALGLLWGNYAYGRLLAGIESKQPLHELDRLAETLEERLLQELDPKTAEGDALRAGRWSEMARLSSLARGREPLLKLLRQPPAAVVALTSEVAGSQVVEPTAEDARKVKAAAAVSTLLQLRPALRAEGADAAIFEQAETALDDIQEFLGG